MGNDNTFALGYGAGLPDGITTFEQFEEFAKSVQVSSYQTDHDGMTGTAAIRKESLEQTLRAVVAQSNTFTLWKNINRLPVTSAVHEWLSQESRGGQIDGMNIAELGEIQFDHGEYTRHVERIKLFATGVSISMFAGQQGYHGPTLQARENTNGIVRIGNAVERALFRSREDMSPNKINGLLAQLRKYRGGKQIINTNGLSDINEVTKLLFKCKADVRQAGSFGDITDIYVDSYLQNALDTNLFTSYRVHLDANKGSLEYGAPVAGIKTSYGVIGIKDTIWNDNAANTQPAVVQSGGKLPTKAPSAPTITGTPLATGTAGGAAGWTADRAGEFWYSVALVDADGREGPLSPIVSVTVPTGGGARIAGSAAASAIRATGGKVYRSTRNPGAVPSAADLRLAGEFVVNEADGSYVYDDVNQRIPGASSIPVMNLNPMSIQFLQLMPATQVPLYPNATLAKPWAIAMFGALQVALPQHHYWIDNVLPDDLPWHPFKAQ